MTFKEFRKQHEGGYYITAAEDIPGFYKEGQVIYGDCDDLEVESWLYQPLNGIYSVRLKNHVEEKSEEENCLESLKEAMENLKSAFVVVLSLCDYNMEFGSKYPFQKNFVEVVDDVVAWVDDEVGEEAKPYATN